MKIGGEIIQNGEMLKELVKAVEVLRSENIVPVLLHGAGPQVNDCLDDLGIVPEYVDGLRKTNLKTLNVVNDVFRKANEKIVLALSERFPVVSVERGVILAKVKNVQRYGHVGEVCAIMKQPVVQAMALGQVPVLSCMGQDGDQMLNVNADIAARELSIALQPWKTIFVTAKGGWMEPDGKLLDRIVMEQQYEQLSNRVYTGRQGTLLKLNEIKKLLDHLPDTSSVILTSAKELAQVTLNKNRQGTICTKNISQQNKKYRVGVLGARGYVGRELLRLIAQHPNLELAHASSRALKDKNVLQYACQPPLNPHTNLPATMEQTLDDLNIDPHLKFNEITQDMLSDNLGVDIWILALPNGHAQKYSMAIQEQCSSVPLIVDLSADHRFNDDWVYGLPELTGRRKLQNATQISNPGCYATATQLAIGPMVAKCQHSSNSATLLAKSSMPVAFGVSGYSGAGTSLCDSNNLEHLRDNILGYKPVQHIHEREVSHQLNTSVAFMPHVASFFRGIHITATMQVEPDMSLEHIVHHYTNFYQHEHLITVDRKIPTVRNIVGSHGVQIGGFALDSTKNRLVVYATIDNLLKGAASQAIQNINIAKGIHEFSGLQTSQTT